MAKDLATKAEMDEIVGKGFGDWRHLTEENIGNCGQWVRISELERGQRECMGVVIGLARERGRKRGEVERMVNDVLSPFLLIRRVSGWLMRHVDCVLEGVCGDGGGVSERDVGAEGRSCRYGRWWNRFIDWR